MRTMRVAPALAVVVATGISIGCQDPAEPAEGPSANELAELALDADAFTGLMIDGLLVAIGFGAGSDAPGVQATDPRSFSRERNCPAGGTLSVEGRIDREASGEGVVEIEVSGSGAWHECARSRGDRTLVIDGAFTFESYRKRVNHQPVGPQTSSKQGSFDWTRSDGRSGHCDFQIESVRLPDAGRIEISGTMCGREIDVTRPWPRHG